MKRQVKPKNRKYYIFRGYDLKRAEFLGTYSSMTPKNAIMDAHLEWSTRYDYKEVIERKGFYQVCYWEDGQTPTEIPDPSLASEPCETDSMCYPTLATGFNQVGVNAVPTNYVWVDTYEYIALDIKPSFKLKLLKIKEELKNIKGIFRDIYRHFKYEILMKINRIKFILLLDYDEYDHYKEAMKKSCLEAVDDCGP